MNDNQKRMLKWAMEPSGPLIAEGEIVVSGWENHQDARALVGSGYFKDPITRLGVGSCFRITREGIAAVRSAA